MYASTPLDLMPRDVPIVHWGMSDRQRGLVRRSLLLAPARSEGERTALPPLHKFTVFSI